MGGHEGGFFGTSATSGGSFGVSGSGGLGGEVDEAGVVGFCWHDWGRSASVWDGASFSSVKERIDTVKRWVIGLGDMETTKKQRVEYKNSYNYCGICGRTPSSTPSNSEEPNRAPVSWWDPDDGWKIGTLCRWCYEESGCGLTQESGI